MWVSCKCCGFLFVCVVCVCVDLIFTSNLERDYKDFLKGILYVTSNKSKDQQISFVDKLYLAQQS
jgi:hypothetical protein